MQNDNRIFQPFYFFLPALVALFSFSSTERTLKMPDEFSIIDSLYKSAEMDTITIAVKFKPLPAIFFEKAGESIISRHQVFTHTMRKTGILASVIAAQFIIEGAEGKSKLASESNNHFGVKFYGKTDVPGYAGKVWRKDSGEGKFFWWYVYKDEESSFLHHAQILQGKRYRHLIGIKTYPEYLMGVKKGGYASNPEYAYILSNIIYSRKLFELDYLVFRNYKTEWEHAVSKNKQRMESEDGRRP